MMIYIFVHLKNGTRHKMVNHVKVYLNYFGYTTADVILCENCGRVAADIHHLKYRSQGGTDDISNLMALCRTCHEMAHAHQINRQELIDKHNLIIQRHEQNS